MADPTFSNKSWLFQSYLPFQKALVRGLGVVTPPLLTIILFFWAWHTVEAYILKPLESAAAAVIVWSIDESQTESQIREKVRQGVAQITPGDSANPPQCVQKSGGDLVAIKRTWIPADVYNLVEDTPGHSPLYNATDYYREYARIRYLDRRYILPAFLALFIATLYLVGKLMAVGIGRLFWNSFEGLINRLPLVRNVYSSVKQVSDFAFNEQEIKFTRIVAVEYPRPGIWSMGFVTGEGMTAIREATGEPMVNILMPTSPMPATGFTVCVPKKDTIDLNISVDQAIQFCVSCGVVTPNTIAATPAESQENQTKTRFLTPPTDPSM